MVHDGGAGFPIEVVGQENIGHMEQGIIGPREEPAGRGMKCLGTEWQAKWF